MDMFLDSDPLMNILDTLSKELDKAELIIKDLENKKSDEIKESENKNE